MFKLIGLILDNILLMALHIENTVKYAKPYSADEEIEVFGKLSNPNITHQEFVAIRNDIVLHNMRLVALIAKRYYTSDVDSETLYECGYYALLKAAGSYIPQKNIKFATYASRCIENEILMELRKNVNSKTEISIYYPLNTDSECKKLQLLELLKTENNVTQKNIEKENDKNLLKIAIDKLTKREKKIIELRFGIEGSDEEKTQKEVADMLGISQSYISRLEKKIICKLKKYMKLMISE
jgi:RNA polymerase sporulation-specific sigma factor